MSGGSALYTERTNEAAWIVRAEWINSSPTYYGPFVYIETADLFAQQWLADDDACAQYDFAVLSPTPAVVA